MVKDNWLEVTIIRLSYKKVKYVGLTYISSSFARLVFNSIYIYQCHSHIVLATGTFFYVSNGKQHNAQSSLRNNKIPTNT